MHSANKGPLYLSHQVDSGGCKEETEDRDWSFSSAFPVSSLGPLWVQRSVLSLLVLTLLFWVKVWSVFCNVKTVRGSQEHSSLLLLCAAGCCQWLLNGGRHEDALSDRDFSPGWQQSAACNTSNEECYWHSWIPMWYRAWMNFGIRGRSLY